MANPQFPAQQDILLSPLAPLPTMINHNPYHSTPIFATPPVPTPHQPLSWIEMGLRGHAATFTLDTNGKKSVLILQNEKQLAQLITGGMKLALENFVNCLWMENNLHLPCSGFYTQCRHYATYPITSVPSRASTTSLKPLLHPIGGDPEQPSLLSLATTAGSAKPLPLHANPTDSTFKCSTTSINSSRKGRTHTSQQNRVHRNIKSKTCNPYGFPKK
ncbi:hypothetical protein FXO37_12029 [Capsicum annuum]|nr:hypothetical protein FXO37_12029 [Capsicum annuum]